MPSTWKPNWRRYNHQVGKGACEESVSSVISHRAECRTLAKAQRFREVQKPKGVKNILLWLITQSKQVYFNLRLCSHQSYISFSHLHASCFLERILSFKVNGHEAGAFWISLLKVFLDNMSFERFELNKNTNNSNCTYWFCRLFLALSVLSSLQWLSRLCIRIKPHRTRQKKERRKWVPWKNIMPHCLGPKKKKMFTWSLLCFHYSRGVGDAH